VIPPFGKFEVAVLRPLRLALKLFVQKPKRIVQHRVWHNNEKRTILVLNIDEANRFVGDTCSV